MQRTTVGTTLTRSFIPLLSSLLMPGTVLGQSGDAIHSSLLTVEVSSG